jgi:hypothetical protein
MAPASARQGSDRHQIAFTGGLRPMGLLEALAAIFPVPTASSHQLD